MRVTPSSLMIVLMCTACHASHSMVGDAGSGGGADAGEGPAPIPPELCDRFVGENSLWARNVFDDYVRATVSFEYATVDDVETTRNDWDLLFTDNMFVVNMVVDDTSFVVDLGEVELDAVPEAVDPGDYPLGMFDEHDCVAVLPDHTYWIRTADENTRQVAVARVVEHVISDTVTIRWVRSTHPDRFVPPVGCME